MAKVSGKSQCPSRNGQATLPVERARTMRTVAAERPSPRRSARVAGPAADSEETADLKVRLAELEARNAELADRLAWAIDKLAGVIEHLKAGRGR